MDAAVISTQLIGPEDGLPTPLTPVYTPHRKILITDQSAEKNSLTVSKSLQGNWVWFLFVSNF